MIVRILGEGQFRVPDEEMPGLQELDGKLEAALETDDDASFRTALLALLDRVHEVGRPVPDDELDTSDAILPDREAHVDEVRAMLLDDGLLPGY